MIAPLVLLLAIVAAGPTEVEPSDLTTRPDLVGKDLVVDDRVRFYAESRRGQGFDEIHLRRTEVMLRLPSRLRFSRPPAEPVARASGVLVQEGGRLYFDVRSLELMPVDSVRLESEVKQIRPNDFVGLRRWGLWAQRRGKALNEPKLTERGVELEGDALWIEANQPGADALTLAEQSGGRPIPEAIRKALMHRGFRDLIRRTNRVEDREALAQRVVRDLPDSTTPRPDSRLDAELATAYGKDPASAYRDVQVPQVRAFLDRQVLADLLQGSLEQKVRDNPADANTLAEAARKDLPDRPELAERLRQIGLEQAEGNVTTMRQAEVEALANAFRGEGNEDRARKLWQTWLGDRRKNRISASDAEGRILLAGQYERWLGDRDTAADLLREALALDPGSKAVPDMFLRLGYRKVEGNWVDPRSSGPSPGPASATTPAPETTAPVAGGDSMKGLTRSQVRSRLGGKPDRVVRSATQGQSVEQWIYTNGRTTQVINFLVTSQTAEPRAVSYYAISR